MPNTTNILKRVYLTESILSNLRKLASLDSDLAGAQVTLEDLAVYVAGENPDCFLGIDDVENQALTVKTTRQFIRSLVSNLLEFPASNKQTSMGQELNQTEPPKEEDSHE